MRPDAAGALFDVVKAGSEIQGFLQGITYDEFAEHRMLRMAVERLLGIVGESLSRLRKTDTGVFESLTDAPKIVALRNILVHSYEVVSPESLFRFCGEPLDTLLREARTMLRDQDSKSG